MRVIERDEKIAVLGAGHGGQAMAGHLGMIGYYVKLYNRTDERLDPIRKIGGIQLAGVITGFGKVAMVTSNIGEADSSSCACNCP